MLGSDLWILGIAGRIVVRYSMLLLPPALLEDSELYDLKTRP